MHDEQEEKEEQRAGRNKSTSIDSNYVESGEFRRKFDSISDDSKLNKMIYGLAKKMLYHRSGTEYEIGTYTEDDRLKGLPEEYLNMSAQERLNEMERLFKEMKDNPRKGIKKNNIEGIHFCI